MSAVPTVSPVGDGERLGRRVSDTPDNRRGYYKRIRGNPNLIPHNVFRPTLKNRTAAGNFCVSVDRLDKGESLGALAAVAERDAQGGNETFHGWAELSAEAAKRNGREVSPSPLDANPHHADIILPDGPEGEKDTRRTHALQLAKEAVWRPRPD